MRLFAIVLAIMSFTVLDSARLPAQEVVTEHTRAPQLQKINRVRIPSYLAEGITRKVVLPKDIGIPGDAVLEVIVERNGRVIKARGLSGNPRLINAAKPAVMKWLFAPYYLNGEAVQFLTELTIQFDGQKRMAKLKVHPDPLTKPDR